MKNYFIYVLCALMFTAPANADDFSDKVREILELSNTIKPSLDVADSMLAELSTPSINQLHQGFKDRRKDVARDEVVKLYNDYRKEFVDALEENLVILLVEPYRENFTIEELEELLTLMKTPTFQKFTAKMPEVMAASQSAGEEFGLRKGQEIMMRLISENPRFR